MKLLGLASVVIFFGLHGMDVPLSEIPSDKLTMPKQVMLLRPEGKSRSGNATPVEELASYPTGDVYYATLVRILITDEKSTIVPELIAAHCRKYPEGMRVGVDTAQFWLKVCKSWGSKLAESAALTKLNLIATVQQQCSQVME